MGRTRIVFVYTNHRPGFQLTYAFKTIEHDPAPALPMCILVMNERNDIFRKKLRADGRTVGFLCSTQVKKIENAQEGKNSKSSLVKSLQTMGKVTTVHLFPCRLYKKRQFISILVKNPPKLKLLFLVMLSNLDFRVSNERSGPLELLI